MDMQSFSSRISRAAQYAEEELERRRLKEEVMHENFVVRKNTSYEASPSDIRKVRALAEKIGSQ